jgi:hypothetical protein
MHQLEAHSNGKVTQEKLKYEILKRLILFFPHTDVMGDFAEPKPEKKLQ